MTSDRILGALNIYATEPGAFHGREEIFAAVFGAKVSELVKNADLTFQTREWARQLPDRVSARRKLETAVGVLTALRGWSPEEARAKLREAAEKAGIGVERLLRSSWNWLPDHQRGDYRLGARPAGVTSRPSDHSRRLSSRGITGVLRELGLRSPVL